VEIKVEEKKVNERKIQIYKKNHHFFLNERLEREMKEKF